MEGSPASPMSPVRYDIHPIEYSNTDVQRDVSHDTAVTTDVQESKEGDTEVRAKQRFASNSICTSQFKFC